MCVSADESLAFWPATPFSQVMSPICSSGEMVPCDSCWALEGDEFLVTGYTSPFYEQRPVNCDLVVSGCNGCPLSGRRDRVGVWVWLLRRWWSFGYPGELFVRGFWGVSTQVTVCGARNGRLC